MSAETYFGDPTQELKRTREPVDVIGRPEAEDPLQTKAQEVKKLVTDIFDGRISEFEARACFEQVPREALIRAAWQGAAEQYRQGTIWGVEGSNCSKTEARNRLQTLFINRRRASASRIFG